MARYPGKDVLAKPDLCPVCARKNCKIHDKDEALSLDLGDKRA